MVENFSATSALQYIDRRARFALLTFNQDKVYCCCARVTCRPPHLNANRTWRMKRAVEYRTMTVRASGNDINYTSEISAKIAEGDIAFSVSVCSHFVKERSIDFHLFDATTRLSIRVTLAINLQIFKFIMSCEMHGNLKPVSSYKYSARSSQCTLAKYIST